MSKENTIVSVNDQQIIRYTVMSHTKGNDGKPKVYIAETKHKADQTHFNSLVTMNTELPVSVRTQDLEIRKAYRGILDLGFNFRISKEGNKTTLTVLEKVEGESEFKPKMTVVGSSTAEAVLNLKATLFDTRTVHPIVKGMDKEGQGVFAALDAMGYTYNFSVEGTKKHVNIYQTVNDRQREVASCSASTYGNLYKGVMSALFDKSNKPIGYKVFDELSNTIRTSFPEWKAGNKAAGSKIRASIELFGKRKVESKKRTLANEGVFNEEIVNASYKEVAKAKKAKEGSSEEKEA
jgi:hypothetical protein